MGKKIKRRRMMKRRRMSKLCPFTQARVNYIDFKDEEVLKRYLTPEGKILSPRITGVAPRYQRALATAIKRARNIALVL
ncbi:MAG: 30S ribosomal protein S18 [Verrucomicrobiota bacterium]|nr:30S ribosomal protein S18 [Verrucomicrobiota bacterium]